ncbi:GerMN domain-containing protein [Paenibacillus septentrionalis]|uniref:GerMN domain-containing protein n=1 Tax=Paenibacillus septentrionalis TaxID=429342 RepID=A0ABW1UYS6_9BACL
MNAKTWLRSTAIVGVMAIPVVLSGCGIFSKSVSEPIDPPQTEVIEGQEEQTSSWLDDAATEGALQYTVYLQDKNGYLAPVTLPMAIAEEEDPAMKMLEVMVDQGMYAGSLPVDFRAMIPQGTEILSYELTENGTAVVNFSEPFVDYNSLDERSIVEAITWTLTSLEGVNGVEIQVNGEKLEEMPVAQFPLDQTLTRAIGINIEIAEGVNYSYAAPVTLYFSAMTSNDEEYFVPVTRMINRSESSQAIAAIEELIQGPMDSKSLIPVILPNVEVTGIEEYDGVVHIDLQDESYEPGHFVPSELLNAVILSVAENTGVQSVQVRVNGDINIFDENNVSYSEPVSKPVHVNALKL